VNGLTGYFTVFVGAGIGGALRHAVNRIPPAMLSSFPWATLAVNVTGCFVMGVIAGYFAHRGESGQSLRLFLTTGVLGGYTTFSAFSLDTALLWERGNVSGAVMYAGASLLLSLGAVGGGLLLMRT
jgi:fluoride exporter